ncbi:MAG: YbhB/YbcL family Raf kinase inhibitor-like protein [Elainellaceae cyanobacterium]
MKLESPAFSANGAVPMIYTCDDQNISPPLRWDDAPVETQSYVLIVDDPDAPNRTFTHWVIYDLPPKTRELPEGISSVDPILGGGGTQGTNDFGQIGYGGPCPPENHDAHRYFFKLYALRSVLGLAEGATKDQVEAAMDGQILTASELVGNYTRNPSGKGKRRKVTGQYDPE